MGGGQPHLSSSERQVDGHTCLSFHPQGLPQPYPAASLGVTSASAHVAGMESLPLQDSGGTNPSEYCCIRVSAPQRCRCWGQVVLCGGLLGVVGAE